MRLRFPLQKNLRLKCIANDTVSATFATARCVRLATVLICARGGDLALALKAKHEASSNLLLFEHRFSWGGILAGAAPLFLGYRTRPTAARVDA